MQTLLWCLAFSAGIALEIARPGAGSPLVLVALALAAAAGGMVQLSRGRQAAGLVVLAALLAGAARGRLAAPSATPEVVGAGLVRLEVLGASAPAGSRCAVLGRPAGTGASPWALRVPPEICPTAAGESMWIRVGDLLPESGARLPGGAPVDPAREGAALALEVRHAWRASPVQTGYWRTVAALRHDAVGAARGDAALGFVVAAVLGQPAALPPEDRAALRRAGLGHVVAVSGMNVAVAAALVHAPLLRVGLLLGRSLAFAALLSWLPVLAYLAVTGGEPPALRAALMFGLASLAALAGRPAHGLTTLALAAAALLAWRPAWALDPGLHLSLAAMAVLVHPDAPRGLLAQSWHVSLATWPIVLVHFGDATLVGVLANLVAVPVFTIWVLPLGVLGLCLSPWLGWSALQPAALGGRVILDLAALMSAAPPAPTASLAAFAALCLVLRVVAPRWLLSRPRASAWLPGPLTSAALLAAALATGRAPEQPPRAWAAIGGPRSAAIVTPSPSDPRSACVRDPWVNPEAWPDLLTALGFTAAAEVRGDRSPPATAAVRAELARAGMLSEGICPEGPPLKLLRPALAACQALRGDGQVAVRAGAAPGTAECWDGRGWAAVATDG